MIKICNFCKKEYDAPRQNSQYCSTECKGMAKLQRRKEKKAAAKQAKVELMPEPVSDKNDLVFNSADFGQCRIYRDEKGDAWFCGQDVLTALEYSEDSNPAKVFNTVPGDWKGVKPIHTLGGPQNLICLSEQGLYFFLGRSDKPKALPYQMWIAGEVVPDIRKHGMYMTAPTLENILENPDIAIGILQAYKKSKEETQMVKGENQTLRTVIQTTSKELDRVKTELIGVTAERDSAQPKAQYYDTMINRPDVFPVTIIAQMYGKTAQDFNKLLCKLKIQRKMGKHYVLMKEYNQAILCYTFQNASDIQKGDFARILGWTEAGVKFLYETLKVRCGLVPIAECRQISFEEMMKTVKEEAKQNGNG